MVMVSGKATGMAMATVMGDGDCEPATASIMLCQKSAENQQGESKKLLIVTIVIDWANPTNILFHFGI
jgi:hypothetical protein